MEKRNTIRRVASKNQVRWTFVAIVLVAVFAGFVAWPQGIGWFSRFKVHLGLDLQGGTHLVYQADVSNIGGADKKEAVEGVRDVIERRVNVYGVSEPNVQTNYSGDNYRIIVELAGVKDVSEAIQMIGETPLLEFKTQGQPAVVDNQALTDAQTKAESVLNKALKGDDFAKLAQEFSEDLSTATSGGDLPWAKRGDFVAEFDAAIFDQLKAGEISKTLIKSQFGFHIIKKIEERTNETGETEVHAAHILIKDPNADLAASTWDLTALGGKNLKKAALDFDPNTNQPLVALEFDDTGKDLFGQITQANVGKPVAIFLDGAVISAPTVQEAITDGKAVISGNFTVKEAKDMVRRLNSGALPVPIKLLSQQTIGASLGADSVQKSLAAGIIGLLAATIFMLIFYRFPGLLSVFALLIYAIVSLAIFEAIPVTMTLAGIAGFILSIGMAVDANVLIFERTKEELRAGQSLTMAIENGFARAWTSIRDSNVSSIITCLVLAWFGTSVVKGFAITLAIGILVSMFTAITVTRTFLRLLVTQKLEGKLWLFGVKQNKE
ncbi:MAG: Protein translocase subunit SecD [Parcubacteria group bacterium GW2011_GWA2_36_10]|nr:MAG: Protein translocase subunit SecD [Parcubacteria group bacterium GW2011_GWA2_36_10]